MMTSPLPLYDICFYELLAHLLRRTDHSYHSFFFDQLLTLIEALSEEKKRGRNENFKKQIFDKLSFSVFVVMLNAEKSCLEGIFRKLGELIEKGNHGVFYLVFKVIRGEDF